MPSVPASAVPAESSTQVGARVHGKNTDRDKNKSCTNNKMRRPRENLARIEAASFLVAEAAEATKKDTAESRIKLLKKLTKNPIFAA